MLTPQEEAKTKPTLIFFCFIFPELFFSPSKRGESVMSLMCAIFPNQTDNFLAKEKFFFDLIGKVISKSFEVVFVD